MALLASLNSVAPRSKKKNLTKQAQFLKRIDECSKRLLLLINNLLTLSNLDVGRVKINRSIHDFYKIIEQSVASVKENARNKDIEIKINKPEKEFKAVFDKNLIYQVLVHLLNNAIQYSQKNSTISLSLNRIRSTKKDHTASEHILFCIQDQGVGIPENELELIFEKFTQSSRTQSNAGGKGLGLGICQEIINLHEGKIWAENNQERGCIIKFYFPNNEQRPSIDIASKQPQLS